MVPARATDFAIPPDALAIGTLTVAIPGDVLGSFTTLSIGLYFGITGFELTGLTFDDSPVATTPLLLTDCSDALLEFGTE